MLIVAVVEVAATILEYLRAGHVAVRYIIDTVLVVMVYEFVALWFKTPALDKAIGLCATVATLAAVRIAVLKTGPGG